MGFVKIELRRDNHKVGINFWHMNWQTKYRYKMFAKFEYKNLCEACVRKAASSHNIKIRLMRVLSDHIHLIATLPKGMSDNKAMQLLKGHSSYALLQKPP